MSRDVTENKLDSECMKIERAVFLFSRYLTMSVQRGGRGVQKLIILRHRRLERSRSFSSAPCPNAQ